MNAASQRIKRSTLRAATSFFATILLWDNAALACPAARWLADRAPDASFRQVFGKVEAKDWPPGTEPLKLGWWGRLLGAKAISCRDDSQIPHCGYTLTVRSFADGAPTVETFRIRISGCSTTKIEAGQFVTVFVKDGPQNVFEPAYAR